MLRVDGVVKVDAQQALCAWVTLRNQMGTNGQI